MIAMIPETPLFSVITVCFNNLDGLRRTAATIAEQSCRDLEWVIVDGASRDGTPEYLSGLPASEARFVSEPDEGIYDAMAKGLHMAAGEYVIFMNSGDLFADASVLGRIRDAISETRPDIVFGDSFEQEGETRFYKPARSPEANSYVMFTHHQSIFYRREPARDVGFDLSYRISGDWVMTGRMLARAKGNVLAIPIAVSAFERGGVSQTNAQRRLINKEHFRIYREEHRHSLPRSLFLWSQKVSINKLRELMPGLYDRLRYRSVSKATEI